MTHMTHDLAKFDNPLTATHHARAREAILKQLEREHQDRVAACLRYWSQIRAMAREEEPS